MEKKNVLSSIPCSICGNNMFTLEHSFKTYNNIAKHRFDHTTMTTHNVIIVNCQKCENVAVSDFQKNLSIESNERLAIRFYHKANAKPSCLTCVFFRESKDREYANDLCWKQVDNPIPTNKEKFCDAHPYFEDWKHAATSYMFRKFLDELKVSEVKS